MNFVYAFDVMFGFPIKRVFHAEIQHARNAEKP